MVTHKDCKECSRTLPLEHYHKQKAGKYGRTARCLDCTHRARQKHYYMNQEAFIEKHKAYNKANPDKCRKATRTYYRKNKELYREADARRRGRKLQATLGLDLRHEFRAIYKEASRISKETGIPHDVDHIVPLQNPRVCGLHVPWNLQIIPASANRAKSNKFEENE